LAKIIDVEFGDGGAWCRTCDEPYPEGTALCPRCGGELIRAARHRAEVQARTRRAARGLSAGILGFFAAFAALIVWLIVR
jgi:hypothetical protein